MNDLELVKMNGEISVVSHSLLAEGMGVTAKSTMELINKYPDELREFGKLTFKTEALKSGQKSKTCMLNEHQSMLLISMMRNTPETIKFKTNLIKQFAQMEKWIRERLSSKGDYKVMNATLKETRKIEGKDTASHHYQNEAKLINWVISGEFKGLDRDSLSKADLEMMNVLQVRNSVMMGVGKSYKERKEVLKVLAESYRITNQD